MKKEKKDKKIKVKEKKVEEKISWKNQSLAKKILTILQVITSIAIIVLSILQIANIDKKAINIFEPLLGVLILLQALDQWNKNRKYACFLLVLSALIFLVMVLVLYKQMI